MSDQFWQCLIAIRWRSPDEGGRASGPPPGPAYSATAVFVLGGDAEITPRWPLTGEHFSIVMELLPLEDVPGLARARFLAPDLAGAYLTDGAELLLMEGPKVVGEAVVLAVDHELLAS